MKDVTAVVKSQARASGLEKEIFSQAREISEREQLADLLRMAPTFMSVVTGPEHRVKFANPGYSQLFGHREVLGRTVAEAISDAAGARYLALLEEVYRTGRSNAANSAKYNAQASPTGPLSIAMWTSCSI